MFFGAQPFANSAFADPNLLTVYNSVVGNRLNIDATPIPAAAFTAFGNAQLSTAQKKFGTASLLLDGTNDYVESDSNVDLSSTDFTIDVWIRPNSVTGYKGIWQSGTSTTEQSYLLGNRVYWTVSPSTIITTAVTVNANEWTMLSYEREGNTHRIYKNGTLADTATTANKQDNGPFSIGENGFGDFNGYIDELRVSTVARYGGSSFTEPTNEFTSDTDTPVLLHLDGTNGSTTITNSGDAGGDIIIIGNANVPVTGEEFEFTIGNISVVFKVRVTGVEIQVANNTADVIIWNDVPVDPGNNWVAIDPNSVVSYTDINPGATQVWEDIDPLDP
jgi:hypothetical protein